MYRDAPKDRDNFIFSPNTVLATKKSRLSLVVTSIERNNHVFKLTFVFIEDYHKGINES